MRRSFNRDASHIVLLILLFTAAPLLELARGSSLTSLNNGDFWWHLRTGLEILRTHALPHTGWFSQSASQPWIASSWLYDVKIAIWYQWLGLRALPLIAGVFKLALAVLTFILAGGLRGRFWTAFVLSAVVQYLLAGTQPLPVYCSVLALAIELILLLRSRENGSTRPLYFLPLLFLVWANVDPNFVYGIFALLLFAAACAVEQWLNREGISWADTEGKSPPLRALAAAVGATFLASIITPYGWSVYGAFWQQSAGAANLPDFLSLRFRTPHDYVLLLLTMAAFLALGLRRSRDLFQIALLLLCAAAAFHAQRDGWLLALAAVAVLAPSFRQETTSSGPQASGFTGRVPLLFATAASLLLLIVVVVARVPRRDALLAKIAETYPVAAADYIREHQLAGPLFNSFPWGGFLTWYLPQYPVAIDARADLYGADFNAHYAKVMNFEEHHSTFPPLNDANVILLEKNSQMATALESVPGYKTAYSDNVAVVLVRDQSEP